uniref:THAP-type domain-containing protein n=1 Tax=Phlebotomus papatasi TaxID=29031 RepID=A0A1B0DPB1_PHLPP
METVFEEISPESYPEYSNPVQEMQDDSQMECLVSPGLAPESQAGMLHSLLESSSSCQKNYDECSEVEQLRKKNALLCTNLKNLKRKHKNALQILRRKTKKIRELQDLLKSKDKELSNAIKKKSLDKIPPGLKALFDRIISKTECENSSTKKYTEELKRFALEMDFLSPKAYRFLRSESGDNLPHARTMGKCLQNIDCDPGITKESLELLLAYTSKEKEQHRTVICQLVFDEVYIFKHLQNIGEKSYGVSVLGEGQATQILTFLLVSVDLQWKLPVAYFPFYKMQAPQKAGIIEKVIHSVQQTGVIINGITFDGAKINFKAIRIMGCDLSKSLDNYAVTEGLGSEIFIYPDPVHMLKLVRNTFSEYDLYDNEDRIISFRFIKALVDLQESEGVKLNNHLRTEHVQFKNKIMNVRLAAQTLSNSVANAIDVCREQLKLPDFKDSQGTSNFLRVFNNAFDVLNSRSSNHAGNKSQQSKELVVSSPNGTGFIGMRACLTNLVQIYKNLKIRASEDDIELKTYALNQDHLELFFGCIRTRLGCNTNPTVLQFRSSYKKLLTYVELKQNPEGGNCLGDLAKISVLGLNTNGNLNYLNGVKENNQTQEKFTTEEEVEIEIKENLKKKSVTDEDLLAISEIVKNFSTTTELSLELQADVIVTKIKGKVFCEGCVSELTQTNNANEEHASDLILALTKHCEAYMRQCIEVMGEVEFHKSMEVQEMVNTLLFTFKDYAFENSLTHLTDSIDHYVNLLSVYITTYAKVRMRQRENKINEKLSNRNKLHRLTHFKNM